MSFTYGKSKVTIASPLTTFGEIQVAEPQCTAWGHFVYGVNPKMFDRAEFSGGYITTETNTCVVNSSTSPSGSCVVQLRRGLSYMPGQGSIFKGTAFFTTGTANNRQLIGIGNIECGYYFGFNETNFGIFHQSSGSTEIRALTIAAAGNTETATITLDGKTKAVSITGGADKNQTAYQIYKADYSSVGNGWTTGISGSTVYFISHRSEPLTGTYGISSAAASGTFARTQGGSSPVYSFVSQSSWNIDPMDGRGPSRKTIDPTKGNVYSIGFQYLGFGNSFFYVENSDTGRLEMVHEIKNANSRTSPVLINPRVSGLVASENALASPAVNVPVRTVSMATFNEGNFARLDPKFSESFTITVPDTAGLWKPLIALKVANVFNGRTCYSELDLLKMVCTNNVNSNTNKSFSIAIFSGKSVSITGAVNFTPINLAESVVYYSTLNAATQTFNGASTAPDFTVGVSSGTVVSDLEPLDLQYGSDMTIVIACKSADALTGTVSLNWFEQQ